MKITKQEVIIELKILHSKLSRRPTKHDNARLYNLSRKYFGSWNNLMETAGYIVKRYQKITLPNENDPNLYYFLGLLITDGHMHVKINRKYRIAIYNSYEEETTLICSLIKHLFNYNPFIRKRMYGFNKRLNNEIMINSKNLVFYLNKKFNIPIGDKSLTLRLPFIPKHNIFKFNLLRGIIDGDGHVPKSKKDNFAISSGSKLFLLDLKFLLNKLNIKTYGPYFYSACYSLNISKIKLKEFYNLLYQFSIFYYPRKKMNFEQTLNS